MDETEQICVACKKVYPGNGIWATLSSQPQVKQKDGLCPDCSQQRYPQFYSDYKRPVKRKFELTELLISMVKNFKHGTNTAR